jgi:hypothetical protein
VLGCAATQLRAVVRPAVRARLIAPWSETLSIVGRPSSAATGANESVAISAYAGLVSPAMPSMCCTWS